MEGATRPEHHDLKSTTDSTRNRSENKTCEECEQVHMKKTGERKISKVNNKTNARAIAENKWERQKYRNLIVTQ